MGTRANYIVTGAFTLAVIVGAFGFIFWFQNTAGGGERSSYRVEFVGSVSGLRTGSAVLFNGIRVGRVSGLGLDAHDPHKVVATISVERALPVRADTKVAVKRRRSAAVGDKERRIRRSAGKRDFGEASQPLVRERIPI